MSRILGKRGTDDPPQKRRTSSAGQVLHRLFLPGENPVSTIYVKPRVAPFVHQGDHIARDPPLGQKHIEHFVPEYLRQSLGINGWGNRKHAIFVKTAV